MNLIFEGNRRFAHIAGEQSGALGNFRALLENATAVTVRRLRGTATMPDWAAAATAIAMWTREREAPN